jgi:hypothetical protein
MEIIKAGGPQVAIFPYQSANIATITFQIGYKTRYHVIFQLLSVFFHSFYKVFYQKDKHYILRNSFSLCNWNSLFFILL